MSTLLAGLATLLAITGTVALMIFFNALYVATEFSTVSSRRTRISQMAGKGNRMAQLLLPIMQDSKQLDDYIAACQVGITISSLVVGAYGQNVIAVFLIRPLTVFSITETAAETIASGIVLACITILQVIIGELFPKSVAIQYPERLALGVVIPMKVSLVLLRPFIWLFNGSGNLLLRLGGRRSEDAHNHAHSPAEIELLVTESHESGLLEDSERLMLRNAFRLRDLTARQVMVHRTKLLAAPVESSVLDIMENAIQGGFSRIPLYKESIDNIIGFVHVKDLFHLYVNSKEDVRPVIRDVVYVPETLPVLEVWDKLNARRKYLAIVFDEYGGTSGLITFEDLIEEIFGELQDEFDDEMALIARDKEGRVYLRGDLLVADVNEYLELKLPQETADTLSGLIFSMLGRTPVDGDEIKINDIVIRVEAMADLGVSELSLQLPPANIVDPFTEWEVADHE